MYIRFAHPRRDPHCRAGLGLFQTDDLPRHDPSDWRHREIVRLYRWFNKELEVPDCLSRRVGRQGRRQGICWFRDAAGAHVSQARYMAWLMRDIGVPMEELRSPRPGVTIYADPHQIVAIPDRFAPVRVV